MSPTGDYPFPGGYIGGPGPARGNPTPFALDMRPSAPAGTVYTPGSNGWTSVGGTPIELLIGATLCISLNVAIVPVSGNNVLASPVILTDPGATYRVVMAVGNLQAGGDIDIVYSDQDGGGEAVLETPMVAGAHTVAVIFRPPGRRGVINFRASSTDLTQPFIGSGARVDKWFA